MGEDQRNVAVIGLGYVGLTVAVAFGEAGGAIGFDIDAARIGELKQGYDRTREVSEQRLSQAAVTFTDDVNDLTGADFFIIAVPTPIDAANQPDLDPLLESSRVVGAALRPGDIVVYESTVYPGVTEEICVPALEESSGLVSGRDFHVGYSPERINPGDADHSFERIVKVVSAQDEATLDIVAATYGSVVEAGVYQAESIMVTEAAKVIENTQRDLNIALMNELAVIFDRIGVDTGAVLDAAGTKWNFVDFRPGLVGGHCIGVDPYYLTHLAEKIDYIPQVILAGRRINDSMGRFVAQRSIKEMIAAGHEVNGATVTVLGLTFKDDCPDLRNSRVIDIIEELSEFNVEVQVHDPLADPAQAEREYGVKLVGREQLRPASMVILAVAHRSFRQMTLDDLKSLMAGNPVLIDVRGVFDRDAAAAAGIALWRL